MIADIYKRAGRILHHIGFPPKCLVCAAFIPGPGDRCGSSNPLSDSKCKSTSFNLHRQLDPILSGCLCQHCISELVVVDSPVCDCCGFPFESRTGADHRCGDCITQPKSFGIARAPLIYDQVAMKAIQRFKYNGKLQLVRPLAELLLTAFRMHWEPKCIDMIVPVPLHRSRFRSRGFNQSYLMVNGWAKLAGSEDMSSIGNRIERQVLSRRRATLPQASLGRKQRASNIKNAFELNKQTEIVGKHVLLVDDVYTTGATVNECARVLMGGGAGQVDVLTLARAV